MNISENTVAAAKNYFQIKLAEFYPKTEIDSFFWLAISHYFNLERKDFMMEPGRRLSESDLLLLRSCIKDLQTMKPIQYILGSTGFYGLRIKVNSSVLIPRPETEELVAFVLETFKKSNEKIQLLDIGTGSGCIPLAIKKSLPGAEVFGLDVSDEALRLAKSNAEELNLEVKFYRSDILTDRLSSHKYLDAMVSNPPYVRKSESNRMERNVLEYEPHLALFVSDEDPLLFHRRIGELGQIKLRKGGCLFFEINEDFGEELRSLLQNQGYSEVEVRKDLSGKNRMIKAIK